MRKTLWPVVAVTFISTLGNTQDDAPPVSTGAALPATTVTGSGPGGVSTAGVPVGGVSTEGVAMGYAAQGNVAMSKAQHEAELQRAAQSSRQQKALKEAMAAYAQKPQTITTAEQFLAVNRPPAGPPRDGDFAMSPVKTSTYVPEFQTTPSRVNGTGGDSGGPSTMSGSTPQPARKPGLFDFLKSKKSLPAQVDPGANPYSLDAPAPPPAGYVQPGAAAAPPGSGAAPMGDQSEAIAAATVAPAPTEKPDFFSRLFGKGKKSSPAEAALPAPDEVGTAPAATGEPSATVAPAAPAADSGGIPTPPAF
jgi:hypothetical protein